jgi:hypothetical protein
MQLEDPSRAVGPAERADRCCLRLSGQVNADRYVKTLQGKLMLRTQVVGFGMTALRGEGTKAILVRGKAAERLVPFRFQGTTYHVPAKLLRHHPEHPDCPVIEEAMVEPDSWREQVTKGRELMSRTVRCTGGCWDGYEAHEQRKITRGDSEALLDWEEHGVRARARLAQRVHEGSIPGAYLDP